MSPGSHKTLRGLFSGNPSQAELAHVAVPQVRVRQEQEACLGRPRAGNSSDNKATTTCRTQFTAVSPVGDVIIIPILQAGSLNPRRTNEGTTWALRQNCGRIGKWQGGTEARSNRRELKVGGDLMGHERGVGLTLGSQAWSVLRSPNVL